MRTIFLTLFLILCTTVSAQKTATVSGEYVYHAPENVSVEQAKRTAIERARLEAIAEAFGTDISQTNTVAVATVNEKSATTFNSTGSTEVRGEWVADTKEPELTISYEGGMLVVAAKVWGKIRRRNEAAVELAIAVLCNGIESEKFRNGNRLSVRFKSPVKGWLSIYLVDDNVRRAYCLLPYENEDGMAREVKNNTEYTLLSTADPKYPYREATILTTDRTVEFNRLVFVFSTNRFTMPITDNGEYLPELDLTDFEKWLQRNRIKDENMCVKEKVVEIRK